MRAKRERERTRTATEVGSVKMDVAMTWWEGCKNGAAEIRDFSGG